MGLYPHIALFSSNLFHGQITQRYIDQLSDPKNKKNVALELFLEC